MEKSLAQSRTRKKGGESGSRYMKTGAILSATMATKEPLELRGGGPPMLSVGLDLHKRYEKDGAPAPQARSARVRIHPASRTTRQVDDAGVRRMSARLPNELGQAASPPFSDESYRYSFSPLAAGPRSRKVLGNFPSPQILNDRAGSGESRPGVGRAGGGVSETAWWRRQESRDLSRQEVDWARRAGNRRCLRRQAGTGQPYRSRNRRPSGITPLAPRQPTTQTV